MALESRRLKQQKQETYNYFLKEVDPIIANCITHLLIAQPQENVCAEMLLFLQGKAPMAMANGTELPKDTLLTKRNQRVYLATKVSPILTRLMHGLAKLRPTNVVEYLCTELQVYVDNKVCFDTPAEEVPPPKPANTRRPFTARGKLDEAVAFDRSTDKVILKSDRPETAPQMKSVASTAPTCSSSSSSSSSKKAPNLASDTSAQSLPMTPATEKQVQIALLGIGSAGKTSLVNSLQGNFDAVVKPTLGFRPTTMMLGEECVVKLYDLGGGRRIRDIWDQYFHDVHAVIYVVDAAGTDEEWEEAKATLLHIDAKPLLAGKPVLVVGTKADKEGAANANEVCERLAVGTNRARNVITCTTKGVLATVAPTPTGIAEGAAVAEAAGTSCSSSSGGCASGSDSTTLVVDKRLEQGLEWLLGVVNQNYAELHVRISEDSQRKAAEEARKRLERERKVLRNKIASVYFADVPGDLRPPNVEPASPEDVYDEGEGLKFLADEIGAEDGLLSVDAKDVARWVGYQRLALQIVGALHAPISKKKVPMSWVEIKELVGELRIELGLE